MMKRWMMAAGCVAVAALTAAPLWAQEADEETEGLSPRQLEMRAKRMIANAEEVLKGGEEERAVSMLEAVPKMFPETQERFMAHVVLGKHQLEKRQTDKALANFKKALGAESQEVQAEAMLCQAKAMMQGGRSGEASMILRRVTQDFPMSAFANDAYFEIGQIHFEAGRWAKAAEAFRLVGTAVPDPGARPGDTAKVSVLVEAGQRVFVNVVDRDLNVLDQMGGTAFVTLEAASGDKKTVPLQMFGRDDGSSLASIETTTNPEDAGEDKLIVYGGDVITVTYIDAMTADGETDVPVVMTAQVVSSGVISFMDGAYHQRVKGVFAGQQAFLRLRDMDLSVTERPDVAQVTVIAKYKPPKPTDEEIALGAEPIPEGMEIWNERGRLDVTLTESGPRTGVFEGRFMPTLNEEFADETMLFVAADDVIVVEYLDARSLDFGDTPTIRTAEVTVLVGGSTEPVSTVSNSSDATIQARKLLLEAQLLHKWGSIFKDVGLDSHAYDKAEEGLQRVADVMDLAAKFSLDRLVLENTYAVKWDLFLIQDRLQDAIATCRTLVRLYPDTILADQAFMKIAAARVASKDFGEIEEGIRVYQSVIQLPASSAKAEAQFAIGEAQEKLAKLRTPINRTPDFTAAMLAFRLCAETYPDSAFAGESFKRIINYYIGIRDYTRSIDTLERVFQDYPDAPWLDEMLVRWGIVLYRMGYGADAKEKFQQVLEQYPGGPAAQQAATLMDRIR
ncbi:MAG: tetratricopeptide repeat protein [Kiritimatiellaeota bacterium]|nr:tetratricopeptide repeat protein [Kiritimatiellota bacterium]